MAESGSWENADRVLKAIPGRGLPVTILTGFLGAGKTTVLNALLRAPHSRRLAVLINEFGSVDIDSQLVAQGDLATDSEVVLSNGCICCTISNSFVDSVRRVVEREPPPDYLVVETSGVADPNPVILNLQETELNDTLYVDQVLTVVDVANFNAEHYRSASATAQIRAADTLLLSKCDLLDDLPNGQETLTSVTRELVRLRPNARILRADHGRVPVAALFDVGMSLSRARDPAVPPPPNEHQSDDHHHHDHGKDCADCPTHLDVDGFTSFTLVESRPLDLALFRSRFLGRLPPGVFRAKGLLWFQGYPVRFVFQLSGRRFEIEQDAWPDSESRSTQLVVIGRGLDKHSLHDTLHACFADPPSDSTNPLRVVTPAIPPS